MNDQSFSGEITAHDVENGGGSVSDRNGQVDKQFTSGQGSATSEDPVADIATHATRLLRLLNEIKPGRAEQELGAKIQALELRLQNTEAKLSNREIELKKRDEVIQAAAARERAIGKLVVHLSAECEKLTAELYEKSRMVARLEQKTQYTLGRGKVWKEKILSLMKQAAARLTGSAPRPSSAPKPAPEERSTESD